MTDKTKWEYVLFIQDQPNLYQTHYITASFRCRREGEDHPLNFSFDWDGDRSDYAQPARYRKGTTLEDFGLRGHVYSGIDKNRKAEFLGSNWKYREPHGVDAKKAEAYVKTFKIAFKAIEGLTENGDRIRAICKAFGVRQAVIVKEAGRSTWYTDSKWQWLTIEEGITKFRELVQAALDKADAENQHRIKSPV
jgi:hypothetical protein